MSATTVVPVVLCGGVGTRLWPLSREGYPKQFWPLLGGRTMLQEAVLRGAGPAFAPSIVVASEAHRFLVAEQLRGVGIDGARILLEPEGRNSAPAIAAAALFMAEADPGAVLWVLAADHVIADVPALHQALARATEAAPKSQIVTFGMQPTAAESGYGYVEIGRPLPGVDGVYEVRSFIEKPDPVAAADLVAGGRHLWNSGMFVATAATLLEELGNQAPQVVTAVREALAGARRDLDFVRLGAAFRDAPSISIDYAVMERTSRAAVVPTSIGWSDVGSWAALWEALPKDANGNAVQGAVELLDAEGCLVRSEGMLTAVIGMTDAVVISSEDAVLVMPRSASQDVKAMVDRLRAKGRAEATQHRRVYRPWGHYEGLIRGERFQVKKIQVRPGQKLSLQKHFHRAEHWVVVNGTAIVHLDGKDTLPRENDSVYLPLGCVHRLENPGKIPLNLVEVQSGAYLGEDDIVRLEDTYGRT